MFRNGQTAEVLRRKEVNGTLRIAPGGYREAVAYIAKLWEQRRAANPDRPGFTLSVSAPTNAEAHDISVAIRAWRSRLRSITIISTSWRMLQQDCQIRGLLRRGRPPQ